jgi:hypothetical protein
MPGKILIPLLATAFVAVPFMSASAVAETARTSTVKSSKSNTSDRTFVPIARDSRRGYARTTTVKSSKSNTSDRTTTVKSSKSNTSDRTGGGGGVGGMFLNPQPEPPGKAKSR